MAKDCDFIMDFARLCVGTEVPEPFAVWTGLVGVSLALGRRVWLDEGLYQAYPNLYVLLTAVAGRCRKSTSMDILSRIIKLCESRFNITGQTCTKEALLTYLTSISEERQLPDGTAIRVQEAYAFASEFSAFLTCDAYKSGITTTLTELYDCRKLEARTLKRGLEVASNPCFGILGATTMDFIRRSIPEDAVGGGLVSRMDLVYVTKPPPFVATPKWGEAEKKLERALAATLEVIRSVPSGPAVLLPDARAFFEKWYVQWHDSEFFIIPTLASYASRRHVHMFKLALLRSVSATPREHKVLVHEQDLRWADLVLRKNEEHLMPLLFLIGANDRGAQSEMIVETVRGSNGRGVPSQALLRSVSNRLSLREFEEIVSTLIRSGRIRRELDPAGGGSVFFPAERA